MKYDLRLFPTPQPTPVESQLAKLLALLLLLQPAAAHEYKWSPTATFELGFAMLGGILGLLCLFACCMRLCNLLQGPAPEQIPLRPIAQLHV